MDAANGGTGGGGGGGGGGGYLRHSSVGRIRRYGLDMDMFATPIVCGLTLGISGAWLFTTRLLTRVNGTWDETLSPPQLVLSTPQVVKLVLLIAVCLGVAVLSAGVLVAATVHKSGECAHFVQHMRRWNGNERVLDVGCGSGALLLEAAKRIRGGGHAIGIDNWADRSFRAYFRPTAVMIDPINAASASAPSAAASASRTRFVDPTDALTTNGAYQTMLNAYAEGVSADRIELRAGDIRSVWNNIQPPPLPPQTPQLSAASAPDAASVVSSAPAPAVDDTPAAATLWRAGSFDAITCGYVLHELPSHAERVRLISQLLTLLRPGGTLAVLDLYHEQVLTAFGANEIDYSRLMTWRPICQWLFGVLFDAGAVVYQKPALPTPRAITPIRG